VGLSARTHPEFVALRRDNNAVIHLGGRHSQLTLHWHLNRSDVFRVSTHTFQTPARLRGAYRVKCRHFS